MTRPSALTCLFLDHSFLSVEKSIVICHLIPHLFFYMAGRIPCTCGCGLEVTYAMKQNHLNAHGKTSLRARVVTEARLLKRNTWQRQEPTPLPQRGSKKWASSNPDWDGSRKQLKAAQLEGNQLPGIASSSQLTLT